MRHRAATLAAMTIAAAAGLVAAPATPAHAQTACEVDYQVHSDWGTGMVVGITITNLQEPVNGWTLAFTFPGDQQIINGWGAIWTQNGPDVTADSLPWNASLGTGASTAIGFYASHSGGPHAPAGFTLNGVPCTGETEPNEPPVVTLTNPEEGWSDVLGCEILFTADASDPDGEVTQVEFYLNDTLVATDDEAPYEFERPVFSQRPAQLGENIAFARAFDDGDPALSTDSQVVTFFQTEPPPAPPPGTEPPSGVDRCRSGVPPQPPEVTLTSPGDNSGFVTGCDIPLAADATDDRVVTLVEFYVNDQLVGSDDEAPYAIDIPSDHPVLAPFSGDNSAYARAYDNDIPPSIGTSPEVTFFQLPPPPTVEVLVCTHELELEAGEAATITYLGSGLGPGFGAEVELTVTGATGVTVAPSTFTIEGRQDVTVTAAPDSAGQTATIQGTAESSELGTLPVGTVTVTVGTAGGTT